MLKNLNKEINLAKLMLFLAMVLVLSGCSSKSNSGDGLVQLELQKTEIEADVQYLFLDVKASGEWELRFENLDGSASNWCSVAEGEPKGVGSKTISLRLAKNTSGEDRTVKIILRAGIREAETELLQKRGTMGIVLPEPEVGSNAEAIHIDVKATGGWTLHFDYTVGAGGWLSSGEMSGVGNKRVLINIQKNETGSERKADIILRSQGGAEEVKAELTQSSTPTTPGELGLILKESVVEANVSSVFLDIEATSDWLLRFDYGSGTTGWCTASQQSGVGSKRVVLNLVENPTESDRKVIIILESEGKELKAELTQKGKKTGPGEGNVPPGWLEVPRVKEQANTRFAYHKTTISGRSVRNFSLKYDTKEKVAYWVAYPHIQSYIGGSGRSNAWQYDPKYTNNEQVNLKKGISGFDRGHQIPSGDRTSDRATNSQTFYYTNMTPQNKTLNQGWWASLENKVRGWLSSDTLYVVTGAILKTKNGSEVVSYAKDNNGVKMAIPNYYFKVLLQKHSRGTGGSKHGYRSIGFWIDNSSHTTGEGYLKFAKSVREIEDLTGFDFFYMLPDVDKNITTQMAEEIETAFMPDAWGGL